MTDGDERVRARLAYNPGLPVDLLIQLASDPSALVAEGAMARLRKP
ncbi:hypothetical protein LAJ19_19660 (plasmid) [Deinococcus taeanensis]|nr:hypothetical protein LAJ19_19660 [Deinococcus taeanensis]